jgi:predicted amidohydrolase YtcJ
MVHFFPKLVPKITAPLLALTLLGGCGAKREAVDLLVTNATVYTVDSTFSKVEAFAVKNGKFVAVGPAADLKAKYEAAQEVDAGGKFIYPGFYDAHCHFYRYAAGLSGADLVGTKSWAEVVQKLQETRRKYPKARWLTGRGWDQNDWPTKQFPTKDTLDRLFPDVPVYISRVDGHASMVNQKLLDLAGITARTPISGGVIGRDAQGRLTGLLVDNAQGLLGKVYPVTTAAEDTPLLLQAQQNCLAVGLTSLAEAGLQPVDIAVIDSLQKLGQLHLRINAMVSASPTNVAYYLKKGPVRTDQLTVVC